MMYKSSAYEMLEGKWNEYVGAKMGGWNEHDILYDVERTSFSPEVVTALFDRMDYVKHSTWDRIRAGWASDFLVAAVFPRREHMYVDENKDDYECSNGFFKYIPYPRWDFIEYVKQVYNSCGKPNMRFIDVGGGIGDKALIAKVLMGFKYATSLEYNLDTHKVAKESIGSGYGISIKRGDALKYNFGESSRPIFAYMYCPIAREDMLIQLYDRVASTMPEGSIIYDIAQNCGYGDPFVRWANEVADANLDLKTRTRIGERSHEHVALGKINGKPVLHIIREVQNE